MVGFGPQNSGVRAFLHEDTTTEKRITMNRTHIRRLIAPAVVLGNVLALNSSKASITDFTDANYWTPVTDGSGVTASSVNKVGSGVQIRFDPGAQPGSDGGMSAGYLSTFTLQGDFVIELNYALNIWPPAPNGVRMAISLGPNIGQTRESTIFTSGDGYNFAANGWHIVPTTDQSGTLMLADMGGTLSGYYWSAADAAWVLLGSASGFSGSYPVAIGSWSDSTFSHQEVVDTLSGIQITTGADAVIPGPVITSPPQPPSTVPEASTIWTGVLSLAVLAFTSRKALSGAAST